MCQTEPQHKRGTFVVDKPPDAEPSADTEEQQQEAPPEQVNAHNRWT